MSRNLAMTEREKGSLEFSLGVLFGAWLGNWETVLWFVVGMFVLAAYRRLRGRQLSNSLVERGHDDQ